MLGSGGGVGRHNAVRVPWATPYLLQPGERIQPRAATAFLCSSSCLSVGAGSGCYRARIVPGAILTTSGHFTRPQAALVAQQSKGFSNKQAG